MMHLMKNVSYTMLVHGMKPMLAMLLFRIKYPIQMWIVRINVLLLMESLAIDHSLKFTYLYSI